MQVVGKKYKYLGLFTSEADAAIAYDRAAVQAKRLHAQTNFDISNYTDLLSAPPPISLSPRMPTSQPSVLPAPRLPGLLRNLYRRSVVCSDPLDLPWQHESFLFAAARRLCALCTCRCLQSSLRVGFVPLQFLCVRLGVRREGATLP